MVKLKKSLTLQDSWNDLQFGMEGVFNYRLNLITVVTASESCCFQSWLLGLTIATAREPTNGVEIAEEHNDRDTKRVFWTFFTFV